MISPTSRYAQVGTASLRASRNGQPVEIRYFLRRFIPPLTGQVSFIQHVVHQGDRVDNITARYLSDPTVFWRVADFNQALKPEELTATEGRVLDIALPLFAGSSR